MYQNDLKVGYTRSASSSKRGWYITLPDDGERVIDRALVKGELVYFNTVIPDTSTCDAGGKGWENVVQMANGGSARGAQWDVNQNGSLDTGDTHAGISFAGRRCETGQPGAPKIIGNRLFTTLTHKVSTAKGIVAAVCVGCGGAGSMGAGVTGGMGGSMGLGGMRGSMGLGGMKGGGTALDPGSSSGTSGRISWMELQPKETD